jgi:hypothetical protein
MSASAPPVTIRLWARSWWLVGSGPSYLLFRAEEGRVMHLTKQLPRNLREALKGYQAVKNGRLLPQVYALNLISLLHSPLKDQDRLTYKEADFTVLSTIEHLIYQSPDEKNFEKGLARFASNIRAARRFVVAENEFAGGPKYTWAFDMARSTGWLIDACGREIMITYYTDPARATTEAKYRFRCVVDSPITRATQTVWNRERQSLGDQASCLYRIPTRKELREELLLDEPGVTKLCRAEGFGWLPRARVRDSKTRTGLRPSLWAA